MEERMREAEESAAAAELELREYKKKANAVLSVRALFHNLIGMVYM